MSRGPKWHLMTFYGTQTWRHPQLNCQAFISPGGFSLPSILKAQSPTLFLSDFPPLIPARAPGKDRPDRRGS